MEDLEDCRLYRGAGMKRWVITGTAARTAICRWIMEAPDGWIVTLKAAVRNLEQNAKMWAMLHDIEQQCEWHGIKLADEEWKDLFSAGLVKSKVVPNLDGTGFVILGQRTSQMTKSQMSDLIELIYAFGAERNVVWSEQSTKPKESHAN